MRWLYSQGNRKGCLYSNTSSYNTNVSHSTQVGKQAYEEADPLHCHEVWALLCLDCEGSKYVFFVIAEWKMHLT